MMSAARRCSGRDVSPVVRALAGHLASSASTCTNLDWALMTYRGHRRRELRARLLPRVAGARDQGGAARDAAGRGAAEDARGANCTRTSSSTRCTRSRRCVHTQPDAADRMISRLSDLLRITFAGRVPRACRCRRSSSSCRSTSRSSRRVFRIGSPSDYDIDPGHARRRSAAPDPAAAGRERDQARRVAADRAGHDLASRRGRDGDVLWLEVRDNGVGLTRRRAGAARQRRRTVQHPRPARMPLRRRAGARLLRSGPGPDRRDARSRFTASRRAATRRAPRVA